MIYAISNDRPPLGRVSRHANTKIKFRGFEISIAMDDSCGRLANLSRTDIRVFDPHGQDVTDHFDNVGNGEALFEIMQRIDTLSRTA